MSTSSIQVAGETIEISDGLKYLGVSFDSSLAMDKLIAVNVNQPVSTSATSLALGASLILILQNYWQYLSLDPS